MLYALNLAEDNRILSAGFYKYLHENLPLVESIPNGDVTDYKYIDGEFIYDPLPKSEPSLEPTQLDIIEAQVTYTAMMTDTLLEV